MDHPNTKTVTRYGVSIQSTVDGTLKYLTGLRSDAVQPGGSGGWGVLFTPFFEDACTWGSEDKAKVVAASLHKSVEAYGSTIKVVPIEEPTYND
jgi:hypothetical protein